MQRSSYCIYVCMLSACVANKLHRNVSTVVCRRLCIQTKRQKLGLHVFTPWGRRLHVPKASSGRGQKSRRGPSSLVVRVKAPEMGVWGRVTESHTDYVYTTKDSVSDCAHTCSMYGLYGSIYDITKLFIIMTSKHGLNWGIPPDMYISSHVAVSPGNMDPPSLVE